MAKKPNYRFERAERERRQAERQAKRDERRAERRKQSDGHDHAAAPSPPAERRADGGQGTEASDQTSLQTPLSFERKSL